ncbi:hypothetical protein NE237_024526 [Protea cynaroides]|uniref:Uncharacterized protein n=1 Tax=Protea cynaroides TaxID=273540 RepID=A0A9Q0H3H6_9MAGN|nr:hypothetical protein NE237_024526 [Protea cynaroides]
MEDISDEESDGFVALDNSDKDDSSNSSSDYSHEEGPSSKCGQQKYAGMKMTKVQLMNMGLFQRDGFIVNTKWLLEQALDGSDEDDSSNSSSDDSLEEGPSKRDEEALIDKKNLKSSQSIDSNKKSGNNSLEKIFSDDGYEIDDEVAEDYLEGIGESFGVVNAMWLLELALDCSDEDDSSNSSSDDSPKEGPALKCGSQNRNENEDEEGSTDEERASSKSWFCGLEEIFSDDGFKIDYEVAENYLKKIGGSFEAVNIELLLEQALDGLDEDDCSKSSSNDNLEERPSLKCGLQKHTGNKDEEDELSENDSLEFSNAGSKIDDEVVEDCLKGIYGSFGAVDAE